MVMRDHFEYTRGMIIMKNKSTISMGKGTEIKSLYSSPAKNQLQLLYFTETNLFITSMVFIHLLFVQKEGQQSNQLLRHPILQHPNTAHDRGLKRSFFLPAKNQYGDANAKC